MKNTTILKDELGLLNADRSAVITELRRLSDELTKKNIEVATAKDEHSEVRQMILDEITRLEDIRGRVIFVTAELAHLNNELIQTRNKSETSRVKNALDIKLHLGRIKELEDKNQTVLDKIASSRDTYDSNLQVLNSAILDKKADIRNLSKEYTNIEDELSKIKKAKDSLFEEDKRLTKERLKKEDKIRNRERILDAKLISLDKKEEDLITMSKDMSVIYMRLKRLYLDVNPEVDLDKLVMQAI